MVRQFVKYYDLIYDDKDYTYDVEVFKELTKNLDWSDLDILEIGAGTGNQTKLLARDARQVFCCETDPDFIDVFRNKLAASPLKNVALWAQPIEQAPERKFGAAVAFFHVINYIRSDALASFLAGLARRMRPGAPFVADLWQGEAVFLSPPKPERRMKKVDSYEIDINIDPHFDRLNASVRLDYAITLAGDGQIERFTESLELQLWMREQLGRHFRDAGFSDLEFWDYRAFPRAADAESWRMWLRCYRSQD